MHKIDGISVNSKSVFDQSWPKFDMNSLSQVVPQQTVTFEKSYPVQLSNGIYMGEWSDGMRNGRGTMEWHDSGKYCGG